MSQGHIVSLSTLMDAMEDTAVPVRFANRRKTLSKCKAQYMVVGSNCLITIYLGVASDLTNACPGSSRQTTR
jgi:hypothetical protein